MTDTPNDTPASEEHADEEAAPIAGQNIAGNENAAAPGYYRDHIVDRTGELIDAAFNRAADHMRVAVGGLTDPRDGTVAHFVIGRDDVDSIDPMAFDAYRKRPLRLRGLAAITRIGSFIDLTKRFATTHSALFVDENPKAPAITAVINYHPAGGMEPDWGDHIVHYGFPLSKEWQAWMGGDAKPMAMGDFARFLEDHIVDVLAETGELDAASKSFVALNSGTFASPSKLIEISRGLQVHESSILKETRNLSTGESEFTFDTEHKDADGKPLRIPNLFMIAIPVFARETIAYRLIARLRYRKQGGQLVFWYELWRADEVFNTALEEAVDHVGARTGLPVFYGAQQA